MKRFLSYIAVLLALGATGGAAQSLSTSETRALDARIALYANAVEHKDAAALLTFLPQRVMQAMAAGLELDVPAAEDAFVHMMDTALEGVSIKEVTISFDNTSLAQTTTGRTYLSLSSLTVAAFPDGDIFEDTGRVIAFSDGGIWYLVNVDSPRQIEFLTMAYPEFKGVSDR